MRNKKLMVYIFPILVIGIIGYIYINEKTSNVKYLTEKIEYGPEDYPASIKEKITVDLDYYVSEDSSEIVNSKIEIDLSNYITGKEAYQELLEASPINKEAPEGLQWIIFDASITMLEASKDDPFNSFPLIEFISENVKDYPSSPVYVLDDKIKDFSLYEGESISGKIAGYIPLNETFKIRYTDNRNSVKEVVQSKHNFKIELYFNEV